MDLMEIELNVLSGKESFEMENRKIDQGVQKCQHLHASDKEILPYKFLRNDLQILSKAFLMCEFQKLMYFADYRIVTAKCNNKKCSYTDTSNCDFNTGPK